MARLKGCIVAVVAGFTIAAATSAAAVTTVNFSFTAGLTPVQGVFTLDCPPGSGPCTILALEGMFGSTPISRNPDTKPPMPPEPPPPPVGPLEPDDLLERPNYEPTPGGFDFWSGTVPYHGFLRKEDETRFLLLLYDDELQERYSEYTVTDYNANIPEPATWTMLLLGFAGVGAALRRPRPVSMRA
jgi:hypothetical protein